MYTHALGNMHGNLTAFVKIDLRGDKAFRWIFLSFRSKEGAMIVCNFRLNSLRAQLNIYDNFESQK